MENPEGRVGAAPYHLFEVFGVELEYMLVDRDDLSVRPLCDRLLREAVGAPDWVDEIQPDGPGGGTLWSNELALHVVEFKTAHPVPALTGLAELFHRQVRHANEILSRWNARLMPGPMHPWMDPVRETHLWPHGQRTIYRAFDRIFGCSGHGWANLQSTHINLPFHGDDEFRRLHAAIRTALPLLPGLAAGSPFAESLATGRMDQRLHVYRGNCARIPAITGRVVPEPVTTGAEYQAQVLQPIYHELAPLDPQGILREEWVNARGAIARFDRGAIEIRVLDIQECPAADLANVEVICALVRALAEERLSGSDEQLALGQDTLCGLYEGAVSQGDLAVVDQAPLLRALGLSTEPRTLQQVWQALAANLSTTEPALRAALRERLQQGCLARRLLRARENGATQPQIGSALCQCLEKNELFAP